MIYQWNDFMLEIDKLCTMKQCTKLVWAAAQWTWHDEIIEKSKTKNQSEVK